MIQVNKSSNHFALSLPTNLLRHQHQIPSTKKSTKHFVKRTGKLLCLSRPRLPPRPPPTSLSGIPRDRLHGPNSRHSYHLYRCRIHRCQLQNNRSGITYPLTHIRREVCTLQNEMKSNWWLECQTSGASPYFWGIVQAAAKVHYRGF